LGQVILDKNPNIKTVVNKLDTIDNTFRNFKMELLAGEDNMIAEVRENTCRFKLDFSKVYWNSRLHAEHERLIDSFGSEALICDGFAGIGPFAIPAAKKGCTVYANDLNPESVNWLKENIKLNKLNKKVETIFASQGSAADFFPEVFTKLIDNQLKDASTEGPVKVFDHVVMNLPATAIEFLGSFKGCITNETLPESISNKCTIHCHSFSKAGNALEDLVDRASHYLGFSLDASECSAHWVRSVAPNKDMYCLSFVIPNEYLCKTTCDSVIDSRPVTKKIKLDTDEDKVE
jgi:tRNA (guanine37-N1)-methyltransferase